MMLVFVTVLSQVKWFNKLVSSMYVIMSLFIN